MRSSELLPVLAEPAGEGGDHTFARLVVPQIRQLHVGRQIHPSHAGGDHRQKNPADEAQIQPEELGMPLRAMAWEAESSGFSKRLYSAKR